MIMCYNFFVGQVYHGLCVHDVVNLYKLVHKTIDTLYNISIGDLWFYLNRVGYEVCLKIF